MKHILNVFTSKSRGDNSSLTNEISIEGCKFLIITLYGLSFVLERVVENSVFFKIFDNSSVRFS